MNYRPEDKWTPEQDKTARDMADDGFSAAQIADAVGRTRNAVLGYAKRRGIKVGRRSDDAPEEPASRATLAPFVAKPLPAPLPAPVAVPVPATAVPFYEATGCRWVFGRADFNALTCNAPRLPSLSWCAEHAARVYTAEGRARMAGRAI